MLCRSCGIVVRVPGCTMEMHSVSCEVRTEFICYIEESRPPLWSEFQATDPEVRVSFPALPDFLRSSGSGTGSTQRCEYNWRATWKKSSDSDLENREYSRRDPSRWPLGTLYPQKVGTIRRQVASLGRYSSLADSGQRILFYQCYEYLSSFYSFFEVMSFTRYDSQYGCKIWSSTIMEEEPLKKRCAYTEKVYQKPNQHSATRCCNTDGIKNIWL
jgi:hypothetical protein